MRARIAIAGVTFALTAVIGAGTVGAVAPDPNPWRGKGFLNIAHQGGEDEAPSNTLFAFKTALADRGADMLEMDVNLTADNELVVIHDDTVNRTTEETQNRASGFSEVRDLTLAEVKDLDAGFTFRSNGTYGKGSPESDYPYRGMADGTKTPQLGYTANDFKIPTLREVLDAFPTTPINIEIKLEKNIVPDTVGGCVTQTPNTYCDDPAGSIPVAEALAELLDEPQYAARQDIIVVSFSDLLVEEFHNDDDPPLQHALAPGREETTNYAITGTAPNPDVAAFQVPPAQGILTGVVEQLQAKGAPQQGYAIHVWPNSAEDEAMYSRFYKLGVEGFMASQPRRLHNWLCSQEIPRPNGADRCPNAATPPATKPKKCKKGQKRKKGKCVKKKRKKAKRKRGR